MEPENEMNDTVPAVEPVLSTVPENEMDNAIPAVEPVPSTVPEIQPEVTDNRAAPTLVSLPRPVPMSSVMNDPKHTPSASPRLSA